MENEYLGCVEDDKVRVVGNNDEGGENEEMIFRASTSLTRTACSFCPFKPRNPAMYDLFTIDDDDDDEGDDDEDNEAATANANV